MLQNSQYPVENTDSNGLLLQITVSGFGSISRKTLSVHANPNSYIFSLFFRMERRFA